MALVFPLLVLVMIGIVEFGGAFRDILSTSHAVRDGARILSAKGDDADADCSALLAAVDGLSAAVPFENVQRVEIYQAATDGDQIMAKTNTYSFNPGPGKDPADCTDWTSTVLYPPATRNVVAGGGTPLDFIGMRIIVDHAWFTQFPPFTGSFTVDQTTISRLEPEVFA